METGSKKSLSVTFQRFSHRITKVTGSYTAFFLAMLSIAVWLITGPLFGFSDTWQLVINTGTTIITFLMVFVIQHSQNKDTLAIQLKLNELIAANKIASNRLVSIEDLSDEELEAIKKFYIQLAALAKQDIDLFSSHSIDEAKHRHTLKQRKDKNPEGNGI
jgi:low affinity Fe/Cu permease